MPPTNNSGENVAVAFSMSERFAPYFAVVLASLAAQASPERTYDVIALHDGLSERMQRQLRSVIKNAPHLCLRFVQPPCSVIEKLRAIEAKSAVWPRLVFYRLFLADMFPEYDKMIFLGVDILVQADLAELYDTDLQGAPLAAVPDGFFLGKPEDLQSTFLSRGEKPPATYCNSDVQVQNLALYRERGIGDAILKAVLDHDFPLIEQDAMNLVMPDAWKPLPIEWNFTLPRIRYFSPGSYAGIPAAIRERGEEIEREQSWKIIHYQSDKPWNLAKSETCPLTELWWQTALAIPAFAPCFAQSLAEQKRALQKEWRKQKRLSLFSLPRVRNKRAVKIRRLTGTLALIERLQQQFPAAN